MIIGEKGLIIGKIFTVISEFSKSVFSYFSTALKYPDIDNIIDWALKFSIKINSPPFYI